MRLASGTIASLALTFGALLVLIVVDLSTNNVINSGRRPPKTSFLRPSASSSSSGRRHLYNYSNKSSGSYSSNSSSSSGSGSYGGDYSSASSSYMNSKYSNGDGTYDGTNAPSSQSSSQQQQQYGDASYYNQNSNYQADGSNYNGRGQSWGGQAVQAYSDDEEPVVYQEGLDEDDALWQLFGTIAGLSAEETAAVSVLAVVVSLSTIFLIFLACGYNLFDLIGMYCCCGLFGHTYESSSPTETTEDGFVKLDEY
jgi:hypothetical protein